MASIVSGASFNVSSNYSYTKAKVNANGGKSIGILNSESKKSLYISTPLMLTWGVNEYTNEVNGSKTYNMALQFPNDEFNNPECIAFLKNMQEFEQKIKNDAITNCKEWLGKTKTEPAVIDALWNPMLKYPKNKETNEPDYSRSPTLTVKIPSWEGEFKGVELYNDERELVFPKDNDEEQGSIGDYIVKGSNVATIIQCGGIYVINGKFGVTWKLFQAVVKPRTTLSGKCHITLSESDKTKIASSKVDEVDLSDKMETTRVEDSDDEDDNVQAVTKEVAKVEVKEELEKTVAVEDKPKKRVVKKKAASE
jgi:hypothetical protein